MRRYFYPSNPAANPVIGAVVKKMNGWSFISSPQTCLVFAKVVWTQIYMKNTP